MGGRIQAKRIEKGMARFHLAEKMGIPAALVESWESNARYPDDLQRAMLHQFLGLEANV